MAWVQGYPCQVPPPRFPVWVHHTVISNHTVTSNFMIFEAIHNTLAGYLKNKYHHLLQLLSLLQLINYSPA
jgi:hypothetical protein